MTSRRLRGSDVKKLVAEASQAFGRSVGELFGEGEVEVETRREAEIFLTRGVPTLIKIKGRFFPTLKILDKVQLKKVVVDMGAVSHVANGADVMAPGVVSADADIIPDDVVAVVDERHGKALAIGVAQVKGAEMKGPKGKVVKSVHWVGDEIWRLER